jgi:hypothetical protein
MDYATSEADRRAQKLAVSTAVTIQQNVKRRTIAAELHPHLTYYAASKVKEQFDLQHNYILEQKTTAGVDSVWYAVDRREAGLELVERRRELQSRQGYMQCLRLPYHPSTALPPRPRAQPLPVPHRLPR